MNVSSTVISNDCVITNVIKGNYNNQEIKNIVSKKIENIINKEINYIRKESKYNT